jgi:hypothetical protein
VVSAHRTPDLLFEFAEEAAARGLEVIIAGAGGAAHLPGMAAAKTGLPVLGVPVQSKSAQRAGLAALDRADAGRHSRGHAGHRPGGRGERRAAGRGHRRQRASGAPRQRWPSTAPRRRRPCSITPTPGRRCERFPRRRAPARRRAGRRAAWGGCWRWRATRWGCASASGAGRGRARRSPGRAHGRPLRRPGDPRPLCRGLDVVTYEFENVPVAAAEHLAQRVPVLSAAWGVVHCTGSAGGEALFQQLGGHAGILPGGHAAAIWMSRSARDWAARRAQDAAAGLRRQGPGAAAHTADVEAAWQALGGQPLIYEALSPSCASCRSWRCAGGTARRPATRWSKTITGTASCASPWRPRPLVRLRCRRWRRSTPPRAGSGWTTSACWPSNSSRWATDCWPTRWRRASTTPATGPSKARSHPSSRIICARSAACPWATPRRAAMRPWST